MKRSYDDIERDLKEAIRAGQDACRVAREKLTIENELQKELAETDEYKKRAALENLLGWELFYELFAGKDALLPYTNTSVEKIERIAECLKAWRDYDIEKAVAEARKRRVIAVEHETINDPMEGTYVKYDDGTREKIC